MAKKSIRTFVFAAVVALVGLAGFVAGASGGEAGGHWGRMARAHAFGGSHEAAAEWLASEFNLNDDQIQQIEAIHELLSSHMAASAAAHAAQFSGLIQQIEAGNLESTEIKALVDSHLEEIRGVAYEVSDDVATLVTSLDQTQRAALAEHLRQVQAARSEGGRGFRHGHFFGHHGF